jgi:hypothetical protein
MARHNDSVTNTLDLDPEWGAIDLIEEIEAVFGFEIANEEAGRCVTVGDVYRLVCDHTPGWDAQGGKCASSVTFYRLRRSLATDGSRAISPDTPLPQDGDINRLFKKVGRETGLRLPSTQSTTIGNVGGYLFSGSLIALIVTLLKGNWTLSLTVLCVGFIGILFIYHDRGRLPAGVVTIGDLVRRTAPLNENRLQKEGSRPSDRWKILTALAAEHGMLGPEEITQDTFLHQKSMILASAS